jgi:hypothetical protein
MKLCVVRIDGDGEFFIFYSNHTIRSF